LPRGKQGKNFAAGAEKHLGGGVKPLAVNGLHGLPLAAMRRLAGKTTSLPDARQGNGRECHHCSNLFIHKLTICLI
jgi:hypothetical protein